jgi:hypothetical protein
LELLYGIPMIYGIRYWNTIIKMYCYNYCAIK